MDSKKSKAKKGPSVPVQVYLFAYNAAQTVGWCYLLFLLIAHPFINDGLSLYERVKWTVIIFQNAAVMEIFHAAARLVASNPIVTTQQVLSRVMVVCGLLIPTLAAKNTIGLPLALLAWSVTEIIRYGYYALNLINAVPYILIWLRYTTFIVLYPIGVTGELLCFYAAQGEVKETKLWTFELPNSCNFSFSYRYLLIGVMLLYIPLFPQMYMHMFAQRRKIIGGGTHNKTKSKVK